MFMKPVSNTRIAQEHIVALFKQAEEQFKEHPDLSKRYIYMIQKIAMKYKLHFSRNQKKMFCKKCNAYLKQGINSKIRLVKNRIVLTCLECGHVRRFVYK